MAFAFKAQRQHQAQIRQAQSRVRQGHGRLAYRKRLFAVALARSKSVFISDEYQSENGFSFAHLALRALIPFFLFLRKRKRRGKRKVQRHETSSLHSMREALRRKQQGEALNKQKDQCLQAGVMQAAPWSVGLEPLGKKACLQT